MLNGGNMAEIYKTIVHLIDSVRIKVKFALLNIRRTIEIDREITNLDVSNNTNMKKFYDAVNNEDGDKALIAILDNMLKCPYMKTECGKDVFCPECSLGGYTAIKWREEMQ